MSIYNDDDSMPTERGPDNLCLNCSQKWCFHSGWACHGNYKKKSELKESERFLTTDMVTTIDIQTIRPVGKPIVQSKPKSKECPCGIVRAKCDYHA
jgi:hypothetical protein